MGHFVVAMIHLGSTQINLFRILENTGDFGEPWRKQERKKSTSGWPESIFFPDIFPVQSTN